jgi:hypothetical protein
VVGVDASEANIKIARIHAAQDMFLGYKGDSDGEEVEAGALRSLADGGAEGSASRQKAQPNSSWWGGISSGLGLNSTGETSSQSAPSSVGKGLLGGDRKHRKGSLEYRCTSAESLRDNGEKFDLVCSMEVLEHVDQPGEFLKCLGDMVKVSK